MVGIVGNFGLYRAGVGFVEKVGVVAGWIRLGDI